MACVHRDRPVEESLHEFERMKNGEYPEKTAVLRMKMNLSSGNPYMWDTIAYRVKLSPHHRTGDKWSELLLPPLIQQLTVFRDISHVRFHSLPLRFFRKHLVSC